MALFDSKYVYSATINAALGSCFFGYVNSVFNPLQDYIQTNIYPDISKDLIYLMTSLVPAGAAVGAITAGSMALKYGRMNAMVMTDALSIFAVLLTLMKSEYFLLIGRLVSGFCVGLNSSLVPLYISEMSPVEAKGTTGTFTQIAVSIGILLAYILGLNVPTGNATPSEWWRVMLGLPAFIAAARSFFLFSRFNHETPKYLIVTGNEDSAKRVLEKIYRKEHINEQLVLLRKEKQADSQAGQITYSDLLSFRYKTRLRVGCFIAILQQFCGINAIIYYSTAIFSKNITDPNSKMPQVYTMIVGILNLLSAFLATALIGKIGRRNLLLSGTSILFVSLLLLPLTGFIAPDSSDSSKYFIFLFILGFGFSLGSVSWIYISEVLPDLGVGVAILSSWISCVMVAQGFPYLNEMMGINGAFLVFACCCLIGVVLIYRWVLETKGKMPHEIAAMFTKNQDQELDDINLIRTHP